MEHHIRLVLLIGTHQRLHKALQVPVIMLLRAIQQCALLRN
jgi:hypothetical protein